MGRLLGGRVKRSSEGNSKTIGWARGTGRTCRSKVDAKRKRNKARLLKYSTLPKIGIVSSESQGGRQPFKKGREKNKGVKGFLKNSEDEKNIDQFQRGDKRLPTERTSCAPRVPVSRVVSVQQGRERNNH